MQLYERDIALVLIVAVVVCLVVVNKEWPNQQWPSTCATLAVALFVYFYVGCYSCCTTKILSMHHETCTLGSGPQRCNGMSSVLLCSCALCSLDM